MEADTSSVYLCEWRPAGALLLGVATQSDSKDVSLHKLFLRTNTPAARVSFMLSTFQHRGGLLAEAGGENLRDNIIN